MNRKTIISNELKGQEARLKAIEIQNALLKKLLGILMAKQGIVKTDLPDLKISAEELLSESVKIIK